jgi:rhodanese-related sulfurtransferase
MRGQGSRRPVDKPVETVDTRFLAGVGTSRRFPAHAKIDTVSSEPMIGQITVADLPGEFGPSELLLDVREDDEWQRGHAAAAKHIPMGEVPGRLDEIDRSARLYVICKAGGRSAKVAQFLVHDGFEPINVDGGMLAWAAAGRPVVADDGSPGSI